MSIRQLIFAAGLAVALPTMAQNAAATAPPPPATSSLSLAQALQAARNNLDVSLARRALAAAQADITAADHAPAPVLSAKASQMDLQNGIGGGNVLTQKRIDKSVGLDWTWERGDKRVLRTRAAQRNADAAQSDVEDALVLQQLAASAVFFDLLSAQERIEQVSALERSALQIAATAARRVTAGDLAAQDAARTDIEAQRASTDLRTAQLDRQRAALTLAQLTGFTGPGVLQAQPDWPTRQAMDAVTGNSALYPAIEARADVMAARQRVEAAQAALDVASAQKKADITVGSSLDHYPGTSTRLLELRLQMPLYGLFGGYNFQGEIARALAQLDAAQDLLEKTRREASADLQRLQQERESAAARALSYERTILPRARQVAEMAELAYNKGALSLTDLIDARRTLRTILLEELAARTDHAKAAQAWQLRQP
ncbi:TolC family protein [Polaromonas sp. SM01]|uniref:TolC family protein n=1 Tax=Polaromonas sp. SM01 TaxID=3085630 RepID=UPI002981BD58|nr:TolC family protein [Polaromonas sp. SM01]MDW5441274.1 TolC family protein [Polaromonas sp. SM01]